MIIRPRIVVLDTAQLAKLLTSGNRATGGQYLEKLNEAGWIVLITEHHFGELLAHGDLEVVDRRLRAIRTLPMIAWIRSKVDGNGFGSIMDVFVQELVMAHSEVPEDELIRAVRCDLFSVGPASEPCAAYSSAEDIYRGNVVARAARSREIASISESSLSRLAGTIGGVVSGRVRTPEEVAKKICQMATDLSEEIGERGDPRIDDPSASAFNFFCEVTRHYDSRKTSARKLAQSILQELHIDLDELTPSTTWAEIGEMAIFRAHLSTVRDHLEIPWRTLVKTDMTKIPTEVVQRALARYRDKTRRAEGGNLNDAYLASMSPYVDRVFVDKRTHDTCLRVLRARPDLFPLLAPIEKTSTLEGTRSMLLSRPAPTP